MLDNFAAARPPSLFTSFKSAATAGSLHRGGTASIASAHPQTQLISTATGKSLMQSGSGVLRLSRSVAGAAAGGEKSGGAHSFGFRTRPFGRSRIHIGMDASRPTAPGSDGNHGNSIDPRLSAADPRLSDETFELQSSTSGVRILKDTGSASSASSAALAGGVTVMAAGASSNNNKPGGSKAAGAFKRAKALLALKERERQKMDDAVRTILRSVHPEVWYGQFRKFPAPIKISSSAAAGAGGGLSMVGGSGLSAAVVNQAANNTHAGGPGGGGGLGSGAGTAASGAAVASVLGTGPSVGSLLIRRHDIALDEDTPTDEVELSDLGKSGAARSRANSASPGKTSVARTVIAPASSSLSAPALAAAAAPVPPPPGVAAEQAQNTDPPIFASTTSAQPPPVPHQEPPECRKFKLNPLFVAEYLKHSFPPPRLEKGWEKRGVHLEECRAVQLGDQSNKLAWRQLSTANEFAAALAQDSEGGGAMGGIGATWIGGALGSKMNAMLNGASLYSSPYF
eukprot:g14793.t1